MKKNFAKLAAATAAMSVLLTGCSIPGIGNKVSTASDVIEKFNEVMDGSANYHVDMDMEIGITAKAEGVVIDLPVEFSLSADVLDENLHGDMEMYMSLMGMDMEQSAEFYMESGRRSVTTYMYDSEDGYWTVSEDSSSVGMATGFSGLTASDFEDAAMEHNKDKGTYTIVQSFGDFADTNSMYENIDELYSGMAEMVSADSDDILDAWEDATVTYVFDEDFYLKSVTIDGCEYSDTITEDGTKIKVSVTLDMAYTFSDYGKIKESDVEVPDKVVDSAVDSITINADDFDMDYSVTINGDTWTSDDYDIDPDFAIGADEDVDPGFLIDAEPEYIDPGMIINPPTATASGDMLGSYNGMNLSGMGDDWNSTFGADGWVFANDDGEYGFMTAENSKYPDVELYVFNYSRNKATRSDILDSGFYGYEINCAWGNTYPVMTWGGLTYGASADDVLAVYGTPDFVYEGSMYTSYEFDIDGDTEITFYVYPSEGLQRVSVSYFGGI